MEEKGYLPEQVFTANKCPILGLKKKASLVRKRSEHQDLRQEVIG